MVKGAIHPNGSNFRRVARLDIVARVRRMVQSNLVERPKWLDHCERVPPIENHSLNLQARTVRSPYPQMIRFLLHKYPNLRFQDCYVDGNDWGAGQDQYRADHPVMQFVARQLHYMRTQGKNKVQAFRLAEEDFRERARCLEREQKVTMAMALDQHLEPAFKGISGRSVTMGTLQDAGLGPMFSTGQAYLHSEMAKAEAAHLNKIRRELRRMRRHAKDDLVEAEAGDSGAAQVLQAGDFVSFQCDTLGTRRAEVISVSENQAKVTVRLFVGATEAPKEKEAPEAEVHLDIEKVDRLPPQEEEECRVTRLDTERIKFEMGKAPPESDGQKDEPQEDVDPKAQQDFQTYSDPSQETSKMAPTQPMPAGEEDEAVERSASRPPKEVRQLSAMLGQEGAGGAGGLGEPSQRRDPAEESDDDDDFAGTSSGDRKKLIDRTPKRRGTVGGKGRLDD